MDLLVSNTHRANYGSTVTHLKEFIDPREAKRIVVKAVRMLQKSGLEFTTIAFRGLSGALIAPAIAMEMDKTLLAVRKIQKTGHGSSPVEGDYNAKNYVIVDDFIASGQTCRAIIEEIDKHVGQGAKCIAVLQAYYLDPAHDDFRAWHGHPDVLEVDFPESINIAIATARKAKAERDAKRLAEDIAERDEEIGKLRTGIGRFMFESVKYLEYEEAAASLFDYRNIGRIPWNPAPSSKCLPAVKELSPMKKYAAKERARLAKLEQDRASFSGRIVTARVQSSPRITSSSLRNISR